MTTTYSPIPDVDVLTSAVPIPGFGFVPVNAFVLKGSEPILVDTGTVVGKDDFMQALRNTIEPSELRWLWLTHTDFDHIGALHTLLTENPRLRVVTTFLGVGVMGLSDPLPLDRVYLVNPGERVTLGDRTLTALRPPVFDNPCTTGFYTSDDLLFSSDCFGALLQSVPENAADIRESDLEGGQITWATIDSPWLHKVERSAFAAELAAMRQLAPKTIFSSHLPVAPGHMLDRLLANVAQAPGAQPFVGPNQAALEQMLRTMAGA